MISRSGEERRLWRIVIALVALIWGSAYFVQFALDFLRERNLLRLTIASGFAVAALFVVRALTRARARWRAWCTLGLVALGYAGVALELEVIQERIHLLEYGTLVLVVQAALAARAVADPDFGMRSPAAWACGAFAFSFVVGCIDEAIQWLLPNRVGELGDVGLNGVSAALALVGAAAIELALARDRPGGEAAS